MFIPYKDKSAASFCHQAAAQLADIFCKFYLVKNHKIDNRSTTTEAGKIISADFGSLKFYKFFDVPLTKFTNNQILINNMGQFFCHN